MFKAEDIFMSRRVFDRRVPDSLAVAKSNGALSNYRSSFIIERGDNPMTWESVPNAAKFLVAFDKHRSFMKDNLRAWLASPLNQDVHPSEHGDYKWHVFYGGLKSTHVLGSFTGNGDVFVRLSQSMLDWINENTTVDNIYSNSSTYQIKSPRNSDLPLMLRIYEEARALCVGRIGMGSPAFGITIHQASSVLQSIDCPDLQAAVDGTGDFDYLMEYSEALKLQRHIWAMTNLKPNREQVIEARNAIMNVERRASNQVEFERIAKSKQNFTTYWSGLKAHHKSFVNEQEISASFANIPLLPAGTGSSRTWGIEVECVQAQLTSRPRGWDKRGDGSLEGIESDEDCNCGCDYCDDGQCYDCGDSDCNQGNTAEFVSPILNSFNSAGLRQLSNDLDGSETNSSAGIHIHVGAGDLTVADVSRLCIAYSAISPFIWPLMEREVVNYCRDISEQNLVHWLHSANKNINAETELAVNSATLHEQPDDRYRDLNIQALRAHGTIEFRAMGPIYNYERLIRWAWMVRELVNISKLRLHQSTWTNVRSMADVVRILSTYGSEQVPPGLMKLYELGDSLAVEERQEQYA
jgi:hypothetical protein